MLVACSLLDITHDNKKCRIIQALPRLFSQYQYKLCPSMHNIILGTLMLIPHKFKIYLEYKADKICIDPLVLVYYGC